MIRGNSFVKSPKMERSRSFVDFYGKVRFIKYNCHGSFERYNIIAFHEYFSEKAAIGVELINARLKIIFYFKQRF